MAKFKDNLKIPSNSNCWLRDNLEMRSLNKASYPEQMTKEISDPCQNFKMYGCYFLSSILVVHRCDTIVLF